jgi:toxin FitB
VILVDTNVVSEPLKARSEPRVVAWLNRQPAESLFISTISVSEILFGIEALVAGKRRNRLAEAFESAVLHYRRPDRGDRESEWIFRRDAR